MIAAAELLADLRAHGVKVRIESGEMRVIASKGAVIPAQLSALWACKADIVQYLTEVANDQDQFEERAAFLEYDCGLSRVEAERQARAEMMQPAEPPYVGFDWGASDPFQRFRRRPDLLRKEGAL
jgi:hypothetical protein